jgi:hypothetical protein
VCAGRDVWTLMRGAGLAGDSAQTYIPQIRPRVEPDALDRYLYLVRYRGQYIITLTPTRQRRPPMKS